MYRVRSVNPESALNLEQLGTKRKYWFRQDGERVLFKAEERGTGEDWAEKVACELAALLGMPHVHYDLATEMGTNNPGVICSSCVLPPASLVLGNQILLALDKRYPVGTRYKVQAHTVDAVTKAVRIIRPPSDQWMEHAPDGIESAIDVFVGYVMLDAWIANQDRHHENWGAILNDHRLVLAPSFDHGAALARNLTDEARQMRLTTADEGARVPTFARKARSAFFKASGDKRPLSTRAAWIEFASQQPEAARIWRRKLSEVDSTTIEEILRQVPPHRMSKICRQFTFELLTENQRALVDSTA